MLARRELSEAQLRSRLARRQFDSDAIENAINRLRGDRSLDDRRAALACARDEVRLKRHGRIRVLRQLAALGIPADTARAAVREVFEDVDEDDLMTQVLRRRLSRSGRLDAAGARRLHRYLIAQGFEPSRVGALLRKSSNVKLPFEL